MKALKFHMIIILVVVKLYSNSYWTKFVFHSFMEPVFIIYLILSLEGNVDKFMVHLRYYCITNAYLVNLTSIPLL